MPSDIRTYGSAKIPSRIFIWIFKCYMPAIDPSGSIVSIVSIRSRPRIGRTVRPVVTRRLDVSIDSWCSYQENYLSSRRREGTPPWTATGGARTT